MQIEESVALGYARGWSFTPLNGHCPLLPAWTTRERETLEEATAWARAGNVGLRTGMRSGVVVVDVDPSKAQMLASDFPATVTVRTGRGGWHLYYICSEPIQNSVGKIGPGIDVRGDGGQVVFVGSKHRETGDRYVWADGRSPSETEMVHFPSVFLETLSRAYAGESARKISIATDVGRRTTSFVIGLVKNRATAYAASALRRECDAVASAAEGTRNHTLNAAAFKIGTLVAAGAIDGSTAEAELTAAAMSAGLSAVEIAATINSGLSAGLRKPRELPAESVAVVPAAPVVAAVPLASASPRQQGYILKPGSHIDEHGQLHEIGTDTFVEDVSKALPPGAVYSRGGILGEIKGEVGSRIFSVSSCDSLRFVVDRHVSLGAWHEKKKDGGQVLMFSACNRDQGSVLLANLARCGAVQPLEAIVPHPVFLPGFKLCPFGWHDGYFYDEPPALSGIEPIRDASVIASVLLDLVADFPFANDASKQNFFGLMLTPLVRPAIDGNRPMHLVTSSLERTGKTKLIEDVLGGVVLGGQTPAVQFQGGDEERDKRILMLLMSGCSIVHLDNLRSFVDSASLASLLTSAVYRGRVLGSSSEFCGKNGLVMVGSGNNVQATGEIAKRIVHIELQPADDAPECRNDFRHPNLREFVSGSRVKVLSCLIGMVENWKAAGCPAGKRVMGGFEDWSRCIGGVLELHGFGEWMANWNEWRAVATPESREVRVFLDAWWNDYQSSPASATELVRLIERDGMFQEVLCVPSPAGRAVALSRRILRPNINSPVGDFRIRIFTSHRANMYRLERVNVESHADSNAVLS